MYDNIDNNEIQGYIEEFIQSNRRNEWLFFHWGKVYVRKSTRSLCRDKLLSKCFDIATIEIFPQHQLKGICKRIINICHETNPFDVTFIEQVRPQYLKKHLLSNGYEQTYDDCNNFFKYVASEDSINKLHKNIIYLEEFYNVVFNLYVETIEDMVIIDDKFHILKFKEVITHFNDELHMTISDKVKKYLVFKFESHLKYNKGYS